jgi:hypothetical protein
VFFCFKIQAHSIHKSVGARRFGVTEMLGGAVRHLTLREIFAAGGAR